MEATAVFVTKHSLQRVKERCNIKNSQSAINTIQRARLHGKDASKYTSCEREYLENAGQGNCTAFAYNNFCYIFSDQGKCVTVYALPEWFGQKKHFDGKNRIRNYRKYCRINGN